MSLCLNLSARAYWLGRGRFRRIVVRLAGARINVMVQDVERSRTVFYSYELGLN